MNWRVVWLWIALAIDTATVLTFLWWVAVIVGSWFGLWASREPPDGVIVCGLTVAAANIIAARFR
jgi:predicted small integral membrane protein